MHSHSMSQELLILSLTSFDPHQGLGSDSGSILQGDAQRNSKSRRISRIPLRSGLTASSIIYFSRHRYSSNRRTVAALTRCGGTRRAVLGLGKSDPSLAGQASSQYPSFYPYYLCYRSEMLAAATLAHYRGRTSTLR